MPAVIKKGRCEYRSLRLPERDEPCEDNDDREACFDAFACLIPGEEMNDDTHPDISIAKSGTDPEDAEDPIERAEAKAAAILNEAEVKAESLIRAAETDAMRIRAEADEILSMARIKAEEDSASAYESGFEQGRKDGEELGRRKFDARIAKVEELLASMRQQADTLLGRHEKQIVNLVMETARQVAGHQIEISPDVVLDSIKSAMSMVVSGSSIDIHLNPDDLEYIGDNWKEYIDGRQGISVTLSPDPAISRGGCLIETGFGLVDATVEGRMQSVYDEIRRVLHERTGSVQKTAEFSDPSHGNESSSA